MAPLFASWPAEERNYRCISLRTSALYALGSAFIAGAKMVRIVTLDNDRNAPGGFSARRGVTGALARKRTALATKGLEVFEARNKAGETVRYRV